MSRVAAKLRNWLGFDVVDEDDEDAEDAFAIDEDDEAADEAADIDDALEDAEEAPVIVEAAEEAAYSELPNTRVIFTLCSACL